jgi:putative two-component system response regulator
MKILVADDDVVSRRRLETLLVKWGHEVASVGNGTDAWDALQAVGAPALAILDWMMPGLDGSRSAAGLAAAFLRCRSTSSC